ncbi:MAG: deoxyguanosinetriphosphate triphosphohydrolase [Candidatus Brocadiae bacterium]|nr:deoxyguanosinetriphosphate triphosphohydrolase [Candidatus Brocadiia bacterium]
MPDGLVTREALEEREEQLLAPYATKSRDSRGRQHDEPEHPLRTVYQRDRDRIIHSTAFRRLEYKTQVFVNHEGDYYRTRLTHTLEVAQIARTIARIMNLNEDLAEAVALAHDLGHTPFGHGGEDELNVQMRNVDPDSGFEHNAHGLRVVDRLERRYPTFPGINLSWELREAMAKHTTRHDRPRLVEFDDDAQPCLEAQAVEVADEIAYNNHDIDDGLTAGLLSTGDLARCEAWSLAAQRVAGRLDLPEDIQNRQIIIQLINTQVTDLVHNATRLIDKLHIRTADDVHQAGRRLFEFSSDVERHKNELEELLHEKLYGHYRVIRMTTKAKRFIRELFEAYLTDERQLPDDARGATPGEPLHRIICDYIAGMTDRYALDEYKKLFHPYERV